MSAGRDVALRPLSGLSDEAERIRVSGLAAKARRGTHAIFATRFISVFVTFASITILSRLIPPADFGIWAMAGLALGLVGILREMGLGSSIVQAADLATHQRDAYFWTSVTVSLAAAGGLAAVAPLLARLSGTPLLQYVIWAGCVSLMFNGLGLVHTALLRRELQYDKVAIIEVGGMLCALGVGLVTGYMWRDVWALVVAHIAQTAWVAASALLLYRWLPGRPVGAKGKVDLSFSFQITSYNFLTYAGNNVGTAAGFRFGPADVGFFNRGQQLCHVANYAFLTPITEVGLALLCRLNHDRTYTDAYIALARRVAVVLIPFAAVLPLVSADLTVALLGPNWAPASPILAWFAFIVLGQAVAALFAQLLTSQGRGVELRKWAVADLCLRGGGALAGSAFGIVGVAAGYSLATFLTVPLMIWLAGLRGPVNLRHQLAAVWPGVLVAAAAALGAALAIPGAHALALNEGWGRLLFVGGSAAVAWGSACFALRPARDALLGRSLAHG